MSTKVVDFVHPSELQSLLPLAIGREGCGDDELERIRWVLEGLL